MSEKPMGFSKGACQVHDARGREVSQFDPIKLHLLRRPGAIESDVLDQIAEDLEPGRAKVRPFLMITAAVGVLVALAVLGVSLIMEGRPAWDDLVQTVTNPAIFAPNLAVLAYLPWMFVHQRRKRCGRVSATMIKFRRCPHCGYSLRGLPVDPTDGATVCPECACAWRLDDPKIAARAAASDGAAAGEPGRIHFQWLMVALGGLMVLAALGAFMMWRSMT
ncbi:MAG: hypothetical protein ACYSU7_12370 [Planctomycetota bacterium]